MHACGCGPGRALAPASGLPSARTKPVVVLDSTNPESTGPIRPPFQAGRDNQDMHPARPTVGACARPTFRMFGLVIAAVLVVACGSGGPSPTPPDPTLYSASTSISSFAPISSPASSASASPVSTVSPPAVASASPAESASPAPDSTVWLCKPGIANDPCTGDLDATVVDATGNETVEKRPVAVDPPVDCFYVYPTVSRQTTVNASLAIDPEERAVALAQAAQFSGVCNVYAPMYRQLTLAAIAKPASISLSAAFTALSDVSTAFQSYLVHYNHGRPIVFIGHSQGAMMLIALLKTEVDTDPDVRGRMVSALLMGGNVTVPSGKDVGGDFANIPACRSAAQSGCVVAYSTFDQMPPLDAVFGRANSGISPLSSTDPNMRVLCVNPAAPGGGSAPLTTIYPTAGVSVLLGSAANTPRASTPFVAYPGEYTATCKTSGNLTWLQVSRPGGASDPRPVVTAGQPTWGLHVVDVNIALGNLVDLVRTESAAFE